MYKLSTDILNQNVGSLNCKLAASCSWRVLPRRSQWKVKTSAVLVSDTPCCCCCCRRQTGKDLRHVFVLTAPFGLVALTVRWQFDRLCQFTCQPHIPERSRKTTSFWQRCGGPSAATLIRCRGRWKTDKLEGGHKMGAYALRQGILERQNCSLNIHPFSPF